MLVLLFICLTAFFSERVKRNSKYVVIESNKLDTCSIGNYCNGIANLLQYHE